MIDNPLSAGAWKSRIEACKRERRDLISDWSESVEYRRGKAFATDSDQDRINVNLSWSLTKAKHSALYSQTPNVILTAEREDAAPLVPVFGKAVNRALTQANVGAAVDEAVFDTINAAGIGAVLVSYEARTEQQDVPAVDPMTAQTLATAGQPVPTVKAPRVTSARILTERLSPSDLLWPIEFTGSDFDRAPWIGRSGRKHWAEAKTEFKLTDEDRETVCGKERVENLRDDASDRSAEAGIVEYDEVWFWATRYDPKAKYFHAIQRLVFVRGKDQPVIDEPWTGQTFDQETGQYYGACKFPIRVLTLTYMSDDAIPPSDTAIGRPQENELIRSRTNLMLQRERSLPIRWFDVNRVDQATQAQLMRGTWQGLIPMQGNGQSAIGEVARANYPREDHELDRIAKHDLAEQWSLSSNQLGQYASGERSATEAHNVQRANDSRIGYERARVAKFFTGIAEVVAGLLALYGDLDMLPAEIDRRPLAQKFAYLIRPDSTVLLDARTRLEQLSHFLNLTAQSGYVDVEPILEEMAALAGLDPQRVIKQPTPKPPDAPNVSVRLAGEDLLTNPLGVALLMKSGQAPNPQELEAAKVLLQSAQQGAMPAPTPAAAPAQADPDWGPMPRITKRIDEEGG